MMPSTTGYRFGDLVLVPFPFTDQSGSKKRPAVVVSSDVYHRGRADIIVMAATGRGTASHLSGEVVVKQWRLAGLLTPSTIKPVIATLSRSIVLRRLGRLQKNDLAALHRSLQDVLG